MDTMKTTRVGQMVRLALPYSEVCMHMQVAGTVRTVRVLDSGAQIINEDGSAFSFPITHGEAGLFRRELPRQNGDESTGENSGEPHEIVFWYSPAN